jgi:glutaredoxin 3
MFLRQRRNSRSSGALRQIEIESWWSQKENRTLPRIEIYSSKFCLFWWGANRVLKDKGVEFTLYSVDGDLHKRREMMARGGGHSVPQIFVDQPPIAGFDELTARNLNGELDSLLGLGRRRSA